MQLSSTDMFLTTILKCTPENVYLLDLCYNELVQDTLNIPSIIAELQAENELSLENLLYEVHKRLRRDICDKASEILENADLLSGYLSQDNVKYVLNNTDKIRNKIESEKCIDCWITSTGVDINGDIAISIDYSEKCVMNAVNLIAEFVNQLKAESEE